MEVSLFLLAGFLVYTIYKHTRTTRSEKVFPGPRGFPVVGNTLQIPPTQTWRYFERLSHVYGPIVRLSLAGTNVLVLNHPLDAEELLGRRSQNYSSRPPLVYAGKHQSNNKRLVLLPYGERLRQQRVAFHHMIQPKVVGAYEVIQGLESLQLLQDIIKRPNDDVRHLKRFSASMVFTLSYGKRLGGAHGSDDTDLNAVLSILDGFVRDTYPGAHLVDTFPILDHLPDFLSPWRAEARHKHKLEMKLYNRLLLEVKEKMDRGDLGLECFGARLWEKKESLGLDLEDISYIAGSAFEAGTDTTSGTMMWFLMAMMMYPETLAMAQVELDKVVGSHGKIIPGFEHIEELPYCVALIKEVFRWAPAAPGGFPHYSEADDEYKGHKIAKNTTVIPCIWSMNHDEDLFPEPYTFKPARFIGPEHTTGVESLVTGHYGFGFGRRVCPGQWLGSKTIYIGIVRLLWAFDITVKLDMDRKPHKLDPDNCTSGMTSRPVDLPVQMSPRSANHAKSVEDAWFAALGESA